MTENNNIIEWYGKEKYKGLELIGLTERSVSEGDPAVPDGALNHMQLLFRDAEGERRELNFYNYRISEKNFEYTPLVKFTWATDDIKMYYHDVFYIEIEFDTDYGQRKKLALTFENSSFIL